MSSRPSLRVEKSVVEFDRHAESTTVVVPAQSRVQIPPLEDSVGMTVGVERGDWKNGSSPGSFSVIYLSNRHHPGAF